MRIHSSAKGLIPFFILALSLGGCGGSGSSGSSGSNGTDGSNNGDSGTNGGGNTTITPATYALGGALSGMDGTGLVLQLNGANDLTLNANGTFAFAAQSDGTVYNVTVKSQPTSAHQTCTVNNGSGTVTGADVTAIAVTCTPWTKQFGAVGADTTVYGSTTDAEGNLYVVGGTQGALHGNTQIGAMDYFLIKYAPNGNRIYTKQAGATSALIIAHDVAVDTNGNIYIVGETNAGLDGNTRASSGAGTDLFLVKYDNAGNRVFTKQMGVAGNTLTQANGVAIDASGVYMSGGTNGNLDGVVKTGNTDLFLVKFDSTGNKLYTKLTGAATATMTTYGGTRVDGNGNVYVTGFVNGNFDGNLLTGTEDFFLVKFDSAGNKLYSRTLGAAGAMTHSTDTAIDANGNVFVTGSTYGNLDGNTLTGTYDMFLTKYDSTGTKLFTKQLGVAAAGAAGQAISVDGSGNLYVAGDTTGGLDGNTLTGLRDLFLTKYDGNGTKLYTRQFSAVGANLGTFASATSTTGDTYVAGCVDAGLDGHTYISNVCDGFVVKYDTNGNKQ